MNESEVKLPVEARRGRPRGFDRSAALETAMLLFWERGYAAVSIADLTAAMGITTPSLYAAFGSKARLYREALQRYATMEEPWVAPLGATAIQVLTSFFDRAVRVATRKGRPHGCMVSSGFLERAPEDAGLAEESRRLRQAIQAMLASVIRDGVRRGELPSTVDADMHALYLNAVLEGLTVQARDGATAKRLRAVATMALARLAAG